MPELLACTMASILNRTLVIWRVYFRRALFAVSLPAVGYEPRFVPARFVLEWGHQGFRSGEFNASIGRVITPSGDLHVSDFDNARVR